MAHKTNNPIQSLGDQPFEQMLRRHLQRNGATANPCAGFDAETANAYLERALLASAQQAFESHLADCGNCRQHVTALARLNVELTPAPVIVTTPQPTAEPFWKHWTAQASAWWNDLSNAAWGNWGLAGAGATACVLIAAMTFYGVQQNKSAQPALLAASNAPTEYRTANQANPVAVTGDVAEQSASSMTVPVATVPMDAPLVARESVLAKSEAALAGSAFPAPPSTAPSLPQLPPNTLTAGVVPTTPPVRVINLPSEDLAFIAERPSAPVIALPRDNDVLASTSRQGGVMPIGLSPGSGIRVNPWDQPVEIPAPGTSLNHVKDQLERTAPKQPGQETKETKADKSEPGKVRTLIDYVLSQGRISSFAPKQKADAPSKEAEKTAESSAAKPMTKQVNGHTLYFERGVWIDETYKANQTLPLIRLVRGSQRYQQVLIDNPMLEEFFQLAPVIVVWKGKIYDVRKGQ